MDADKLQNWCCCVVLMKKGNNILVHPFGVTAKTYTEALGLATRIAEKTMEKTSRVVDFKVFVNSRADNAFVSSIESLTFQVS